MLHYIVALSILFAGCKTSGANKKTSDQENPREVEINGEDEVPFSEKEVNELEEIQVYDAAAHLELSSSDEEQRNIEITAIVLSLGAIAIGSAATVLGAKGLVDTGHLKTLRESVESQVPLKNSIKSNSVSAAELSPKIKKSDSNLPSTIKVSREKLEPVSDLF